MNIMCMQKYHICSNKIQFIEPQYVNDVAIVMAQYISEGIIVQNGDPRPNDKDQLQYPS